MPYALPPGRSTDRPSLWLRLRVWWRRGKLDTALAQGADPTQTRELTLRAQQLVEPKKREALAEAIERLLAIAERPRAPVQVTFRPTQVRANRRLLVELAARLRDHGPHPLHGLAMSALLLEDGRGPLYPGSGPRMLERALRDVLSALELGSEAASPADPRAAGDRAR
jgi:hypothetical protein